MWQRIHIYLRCIILILKIEAYISKDNFWDRQWSWKVLVSFLQEQSVQSDNLTFGLGGSQDEQHLSWNVYTLNWLKKQNLGYGYT